MSIERNKWNIKFDIIMESEDVNIEQKTTNYMNKIEEFL